MAILALPGNALTPAGLKFDAQTKGAISRLRKEEAFLVKWQHAAVYYTGNKKIPRIILTSFPGKDLRANELREAAYSAVRSAQQKSLRQISLAFDPQNEQEVQAIAEGSILASYSFKRFKPQKDPKPVLQTVFLIASDAKASALQKAKIFASAAMFVRDLVNEPPNILNAERLAEISTDVARKNGLNLRVFETAQLEKMGANAFLSVGKGSVVSGRMIHLTYKPEGKSKAHVCFVGKGLTFDSGGLSLKTEKGMESMKSDMAGAATALACIRAACELKMPVKITALLMATENMPDNAANRPGDVVRAMNGKTIEITNTDAEGRLALADGLVYAQSLKPDYLIDIATLTGAQVIGLGRLVAAVMGNNDTFIQQIVEAGKSSGEIMWPLPMPDHYRDLIRSDIADMKNSSGIPEAGSIQGGLFLSEFVDHPRWAHLDIAGPSWQERDWSIYPRSASGFGARCLLTFLSNL
ncbi:leucyl aminopeptidase [bacterium]|nr:leucyl aminopeptidase [bacterium]